MAKKKTRKRTTQKKAARRASARPRAGGLSGMSISQLRAELDRRVEKLEATRDSLTAELEEVEAELAVVNGLSASRPSRSTAARRGNVRSRGTGRGQNKMNLVEALAKTLTGKTMSVTEMSEAVQKAGYKTSSPNFRTIVNQTLIKNTDRFKRVDRGQYTAK